MDSWLADTLLLIVIMHSAQLRYAAAHT